MADVETKPVAATGDGAEKAEKSGLSTAARRKAKVNRPKHSKRYLGLVKGLNNEEVYSPEAAFARIKELATAKFDETVETAVNLGVSPRILAIAGPIFATRNANNSASFSRSANDTA